MMRMTMEAFAALPEDVQDKARGHLRAFNECLIVFEHGRFSVGGGACLAASYAPDHKVHGIVYADDIYTPEERICNYIEEFHDYPPQYKGARDYKMLKWMEQMRKDGHEIPVRLVNGVAMPPVFGKFCHKCDGPVWVSENEGYAFQCFECDEDLYSFEVKTEPVVEGTTIDTGFFGVGFCDEYCNACEGETYNIPSDRVSRCAHCKAELFPCSCCDDGCDWSRDKNGCHRFKHTDEDPVFIV